MEFGTIPGTPTLDVSVNHTIPETQTYENPATEPDHLASDVPATIPETQLSEISVLSLASPDDDDSTFCSLLEPTIRSNGEIVRRTQTHPANITKVNITHCGIHNHMPNPSMPDVSATLDDLDTTFCSLVETELQQTRLQQPDAESFDFEDAIMRLMQVHMTTGNNATPQQDSGTFVEDVNEPETRISGDDNGRHQLCQRIEQIVLRFLMGLAGTDSVYLDVQRLDCTFDAASQT